MWAILGFCGLLGLLSGVAAADEVRGPVTNLPMPRYVSLKTSEANVRRGPGLTHRIDWIFQQRNIPVQVTGEYGHWRRVADIEGAGGWVHYSLLSGTRYVVVTGAEVALLNKPQPDGRAVARVEPGVVARLGDCRPEWCKVTAERVRGWARKVDLWGVDPQELRD